MKPAAIFTKFPVFALGIALGLCTGPVLADVSSGYVELDANLIDDTTGPYEPDDDWDTIANQSVHGSTKGTPNYIATTGRVPDPDSPLTSYFQKGSSKDEQDISDWLPTGNSAPPKDELLDAAAAAYTDDRGTLDPTDDHLILAFMADRYANTGSSTMGFWFTVTGISFDAATDTFTGNHVVGDTLVIVDFSKGGAVGTVRVLEWVGPDNGYEDSLTMPAAGTGNSPLQLRFQDTSFSGGTAGVLACNEAFNGTPANIVCMIANGAEQWAWDDYQSKSAAQGVYPLGSLIEGALDVTELIPGASCFAGFLAETRSSDEVSATLKDFVVKSFPVCGVTVTKTCPTTSVIGVCSDTITDASPEECEIDTDCTGSGATCDHSNPIFVSGDTFVTEFAVEIGQNGPGAIYDVYLTEKTLSSCSIIAEDGTPITPIGLTQNTATLVNEGALSGPTTFTLECSTNANVAMNTVMVQASTSDNTPSDDSKSDLGPEEVTFTPLTGECAASPSPNISIVKDCNPTASDAVTATVLDGTPPYLGFTIPYQITVTNTGEQDLTSVTVNDSYAGLTDYDCGTLQAGGSPCVITGSYDASVPNTVDGSGDPMDYPFDTELTGCDISFTNQATVDAQGAITGTVSASSQDTCFLCPDSCSRSGGGG